MGDRFKAMDFIDIVLGICSFVSVLTLCIAFLKNGKIDYDFMTFILGIISAFLLKKMPPTIKH